MMRMDDRSLAVRRAAAFAVLALGLLMVTSPLAARVSVGTALSLEDERVLYRERRTEEWRDGRLIEKQATRWGTFDGGKRRMAGFLGSNQGRILAGMPASNTAR